MQRISTPRSQLIAKKVASFFKAGDVINLGLGIPSEVSDFTPPGVIFHTENGIMGYRAAAAEEEDFEFVGAGSNYIVPLAGACAFDSSMSFAIIRRGCIDACVLGALQVDEEGNLANWARPGHYAGMGGGMDLVNGTKRVIIAMEHTAKGKPKILRKCAFPLTAPRCVSTIVTELCVIDVTPDGLVLKQLAPGATVEDVIAKTEAKITVPPRLEDW